MRRAAWSIYALAVSAALLGFVCIASPAESCLISTDDSPQGRHVEETLLPVFSSPLPAADVQLTAVTGVNLDELSALLQPTGPIDSGSIVGRQSPSLIVAAALSMAVPGLPTSTAASNPIEFVIDRP